MLMNAISRKNTDILFVVSPANARSFYMPFYFLYLAGYLEKHGFNVEIVNPQRKQVQDNIREILEEIRAKNPRFVGLAAFVTDFNLIETLATEIKKHSAATLLVGNAQPSVAPEDFLYEDSPFDIVIRGEGEITVKQLLSEYDKGRDLGNIPGIAYFENGTVKITRNRELMDLAECGMPAYHKIDMSWYQKPTKFVIRRLVTSGAVIYTGRGCPFNCSFCASNTVWRANARTPGAPLVRKRPLTQVMEELRFLQNTYEFDFFYILDDTFGIKEDDISSFCKAYKESGLTMLWAAETRVNCIKNEAIVKLLKESGCIQLDFGVETGSPKLLKVIHKATTVDQTVQAFSLCRKYGIRTFANILLNLPTEDEEDLALTQKLLDTIKPTYTSVGMTQPYPGTEIYKLLEKPIPKQDYGKLNRLFPTEEYRFSKHTFNLKRLLFSWYIKYGIVTPFEKSLYRASRNYWTKILGSNRKWAYIRFLLKELIVTPLYYVIFLRSYLMTRRK